MTTINQLNSKDLFLSHLFTSVPQFIWNWSSIRDNPDNNKGVPILTGICVYENVSIDALRNQILVKQQNY